MPTFNRAGFLRGTLESIFSQTIAVDEVFLVDDGSTDNSREVLQALLLEHPEWKGRLKIIYQKNQGKSVALNEALAHATGNWIAFDDSDDSWQPQKLEWQFRALEKCPDCLACFTDASYINSTDKHRTAFEAGGRSFPDQVGRLDDALVVMAGLSHGIFMQTILVRADVLAKIGNFDAKLRVAQDVDFLFRLALQTPLCYVNLPLVNMDRTPTRTLGLTTEFPMGSLYRLQMNETIFVQWRSLLEAPAHHRVKQLVEDRISSTRSEMANHHILQDQPGEARKVLVKALKEHFRLSVGLKLALACLAPARITKNLIKKR